MKQYLLIFEPNYSCVVKTPDDWQAIPSADSGLPERQQLAGHNHIDVAIVETAVVVVLVQVERRQREDVGRARQRHRAQTVAQVNVVLLGDGRRVTELGEDGAWQTRGERERERDGRRFGG